MKKYLMTGIAAVALCAAFTSCSHDLEPMSQADIDQAKYDQAFLKYVGGKIAPDQDWGFSSSNTRTRSGNPGEGFAETSTGINANANEWADPTPGKKFGGLVVPDPLDPRVKALVAEYFKTHTPLRYEDPKLRNFFVQQVHTGTKNYTAADNKTTLESSLMNELSVGFNNQHINNFNHASYGNEEKDASGQAIGGMVGVLNKGYTANDFADNHHMDEIMLMANIDDTECFGYKNSGCGGKQINNKMVLVGWKTIYDWAVENNKPNAELLKDDWDRSYLGFDFELRSEDEVLIKNADGTPRYALLSELPASNEIKYAWNGNKKILIGDVPASSPDFDATSLLASASCESEASVTKNESDTYYTCATGNGISINFGEGKSGYSKLVIELAEANASQFQLEIWGHGWETIPANSNHVEIDINGQTISGFGIKNANKQTLKITSVKLQAPSVSPDDYYTSLYLLAGTSQIQYISSDMNEYLGESKTVSEDDLVIKINGEKCANLPKIQELYSEGWRPVDGSALQTWAKWAGGDGYYDDWIVTLTKAEKIVTVPDEYDIIIVAEDLSAGEDGDFDFNDVVLKVKFSKTSDEKAKVLLTHAGGTLPLRINGDFENLEVHKLFGVWVGEDDDLTVRQKMVNTGAGPDVEPVDLTDKLNINIANAAEANTKLKLEVYKDGSWQEMKSPRGEPACKLAVGTDFKVLGERVSIKKEYENFIKWVELGSNGFTSKWWQTTE